MLVRKSEIVDIYQYPTKIAVPTPNVKLVIGDLDGNAIKCLYFLIREGVLYLDRAEHAELVAIYRTPVDELTMDQLTKFVKLISQAKAVEPSPFITFIGDDLCDRGMNDYFMLIIVLKLSLSKVNFEILYSNHGANFLKQFAYGLHLENIIELYQGENFEFGRSLHNLQKLIQKNLVSVDDMEYIVESHYLPHLKLIGYDDFHSRGSKVVNLYTHAPIADTHMLDKLQAVAKFFHVEFNKDNNGDLIKSFDKINQVFQNKMQVSDNRNKYQFRMGEYKCIEAFTNDRYRDIKNPGAFDLHNENHSPDYVLINIHGHVGMEKKPEFLKPLPIHMNTDIPLGKKNTLGEDIHHHEYTVLTTQKKYHDVKFMKINHFNQLMFDKPKVGETINVQPVKTPSIK